MTNPWKLEDAGQALLAAADTIAREVVGPNAALHDRERTFPKAAIDALREAGVLRLLSAEAVGGQGQGLRCAMAVAERIAQECPSTAMITIMHYAATAVIEAHGSETLRREIAGGKLSTLAFSESGSRSHFWVPTSTATRVDDSVRLDAAKQLITSAQTADVFVWSSKPAAGEGLSSLWAVPADTAGLEISGGYDGLGLRANGSSPIRANGALIPASALLGEDGQGFDIMMGVVMPTFSLQNAAVSLGTMEGAARRTIQHVSQSTFSYDGTRLCDLTQVRGHVARMRLKIDLLRGLLQDAIDAVEQARDDAMLRVLEAKLAGGETALEVLDIAMRVCGGAAYRKDIAVERFFRDSRAASVMAPVSDALYDFIGKAICGMPVFG